MATNFDEKTEVQTAIDATEARRAALTNSPARAAWPSFPAIFQSHIADIAADYKAGCRKIETVCAINTVDAAKLLAKKFGTAPNNKLFSVGYDAAYARHCALFAHGTPEKDGKDRRYDPSKGKHSGFEAALITAALGAMRNAANQEANGFNKRKHSKDQALPTTTNYGYDIEKADNALEATAATPTADADSFTKAKQDADSYADAMAAVAFGAAKAANSTSTTDGLPVAYTTEANYPKWWKPWNGRTVPAAEASSGRTDRETAEAVGLNVAKILAKLPAIDRARIASIYNVEGYEYITFAQLANRMGCSVATARRAIKRIEQNIRDNEQKRNPRMAALPATYGLHLDLTNKTAADGGPGRVIKRNPTFHTLGEAPPTFPKGAKVSKRGGAEDGKYRPDAWNLWRMSP